MRRDSPALQLVKTDRGQNQACEQVVQVFRFNRRRLRPVVNIDPGLIARKRVEDGRPELGEEVVVIAHLAQLLFEGDVISRAPVKLGGGGRETESEALPRAMLPDACGKPLGVRPIEPRRAEAKDIGVPGIFRCAANTSVDTSAVGAEAIGSACAGHEPLVSGVVVAGEGKAFAGSGAGEDQRCVSQGRGGGSQSSQPLQRVTGRKKLWLASGIVRCDEPSR